MYVFVVIVLLYYTAKIALEFQFFKRPPEKYSAYRIMQILLDSNIDERRIAKRRPLEAPYSATFVVDISELSHPDDIKKDMYGKWLYSGSHSDVFLCSYSLNGNVMIEKAAPGASGSNAYALRRLHSVHPSNTDFRRVLALLFGMYIVLYRQGQNFWRGGREEKDGQPRVGAGGQCSPQ